MPQGRQVSLPIAIGVFLVMVTISLTVGWQILVAREFLALAEGFRAVHWALVIVGSFFFALIITAAILLTTWLVQEIRQNQRQQNFLDAVTHELHTPLASLRLYVDTLRDKELEPEQRREFIDIMSDDLERLQRTIDQVLSAARTERRRRTPVDLIALLIDCASEARERHSLGPEAIHLELPRNARVKGDLEQLRLAFRNLIDNAVRYSGEKSRVDIAVRAGSPRRLEIEVADHGIGIPPSALSRVFHRFQRLSQETVAGSGIGGLGLGLYIVRNVVRSHGGSVRAESEGIGTGSRFIVTLPDIWMDARILLLEDEAHLARGLQFNLEAEGYAVEHFAFGEAALERLQQPAAPDIDLAVLDVMLPGISGFDVLKQMRADENATPVLLLTARDSEQDIVQGLDMGADDYLTKPFSLPVLLARVRTLLRRNAGDVPSRLEIGDCTVYPDRFELQRGDKISPLTAKELGLLLLLWNRRGTAVSRGEILQDVWDLHPETRTRVVDTFVLRLRKLIEPDPSTPRYLLSVRSFGYRLNAS